MSSVIQVANISNQATQEQIITLFSFLGTIEDYKIFSSDPQPFVVSDFDTTQICYIKYKDIISGQVAQHLTNTILFDKPLDVSLYSQNTIPEKLDLSLTNKISEPKSPILPIPVSSSWPTHIVHKITGVGATQLINTIDPKLTALGLPQYPPLTGVIEPSKLEEIRRTIYVGNLNSKVTGEALLNFFNQIGEVKYVRMAGDDSQPTRFAFVEFSNQDSIPAALQYNGVLLADKPLKINHANNAIVKPNSKPPEVVQKEIERAMNKVKEVESMISSALEAEKWGRRKDRDGDDRHGRSRSRDRRNGKDGNKDRKHRSRDGSRSRRRSPSRSKHTKTRNRSRSRKRSGRYSRDKSKPRHRSRDKEDTSTRHKEDDKKKREETHKSHEKTRKRHKDSRSPSLGKKSSKQDSSLVPSSSKHKEATSSSHRSNHDKHSNEKKRSSKETVSSKKRGEETGKSHNQSDDKKSHRQRHHSRERSKGRDADTKKGKTVKKSDKVDDSKGRSKHGKDKVGKVKEVKGKEKGNLTVDPDGRKADVKAKPTDQVKHPSPDVEIITEIKERTEERTVVSVTEIETDTLTFIPENIEYEEHVWVEKEPTKLETPSDVKVNDSVDDVLQNDLYKNEELTLSPPNSPSNSDEELYKAEKSSPHIDSNVSASPYVKTSSYQERTDKKLLLDEQLQKKLEELKEEEDNESYDISNHQHNETDDPQPLINDSPHGAQCLLSPHSEGSTTLPNDNTSPIEETQGGITSSPEHDMHEESTMNGANKSVKDLEEPTRGQTDDIALQIDMNEHETLSEQGYKVEISTELGPVPLEEEGQSASKRRSKRLRHKEDSSSHELSPVNALPSPTKRTRKKSK